MGGEWRWIVADGSASLCRRIELGLRGSGLQHGVLGSDGSYGRCNVGF